MRIILKTTNGLVTLDSKKLTGFVIPNEEGVLGVVILLDYGNPSPLEFPSKEDFDNAVHQLNNYTM